MLTTTKKSAGGNSGWQGYQNTVTAVGAVAQIANRLSSQNFLRPFTIKITNSTSAAVSYMLGDPGALIQTKLGGSWGTITSNSIGSGSAAQSAFDTTVGYRPIVCDSVTYTVTSSATQFDNEFAMYQAAIDGSNQAAPINIAAARRSNQFQSLILNIQTPIVFGPGFGLKIVVDASETVSLTFNPVAEWIPGMNLTGK